LGDFKYISILLFYIFVEAIDTFEVVLSTI